MKSFYEFYRLLRETNGAPSGGTTTNSSANIASPPGPAQTASMGAAPVPKGSLAPPAHQPGPADAAAAIKAAIEAVTKVEDALKTHPNRQAVMQLAQQVTGMKSQLTPMLEALTSMQEKLDQLEQPTPQQAKDQQGQQNQAALNASAQAPQQPPGQAPTGAMNSPAPAMPQG